MAAQPIMKNVLASYGCLNWTNEKSTNKRTPRDKRIFERERCKPYGILTLRHTHNFKCVSKLYWTELTAQYEWKICWANALYQYINVQFHVFVISFLVTRTHTHTGGEIEGEILNVIFDANKQTIPTNWSTVCRSIGWRRQLWDKRTHRIK